MPPVPSRTGFSLVESLIAVAITTIAGAALLTSLSGAVQSSNRAVRAQVASGLATCLMDEISTARYPVAADTRPFGTSRADFNDLDDYDGWSAQPPQLRNGTAAGLEGGHVWGISIERLPQMQPSTRFLGHFRREVEVDRVQQRADGQWESAASETGWRQVRVRVLWMESGRPAVPLAEVSRQFAQPAESP